MPANSTCTINYFCLGAVLIFLGSILLCALGFTVVLPHEATREWPQVECHVINTTMNRRLCSCDEQIAPEDISCIGKYPCLEIEVNYWRPEVINVTTAVDGMTLPAVTLATTSVSPPSPPESTDRPTTAKGHGVKPEKDTLNQIDSKESLISGRSQRTLHDTSQRKKDSISINEKRGLLTTVTAKNSTIFDYQDSDITLKTLSVAPTPVAAVINKNIKVNFNMTADPFRMREHFGDVTSFPDDVRTVSDDVTTVVSDDVAAAVSVYSHVKSMARKLTTVYVGLASPGPITPSPPHARRYHSYAVVQDSGSGSDGATSTAPDFEAGTDSGVVWILTTARLFRGWTDAFYKQCSIHECGEEEWNIKQTSEFKVGWGKVGKTFQCYYDPTSPNIVILKRTTTTSMIHAVVWPIVCLSSGALLWICLCCGCCKVAKDPEDSASYVAV